MVTRVFSIAVMLWTLSLSALGVAFGADKDKHGFLGVVPGEVTSDIASEYGVRPGEGVIVESVSPGSPASKIGLRENDIIISVNRTGVTGPAEFRDIISKMTDGDKVELTYVRGGKEKTATAELTSREDRNFEFMVPGVPKPPMAPGAPEMRRRAIRERVRAREHEAPRAEKVAFAGLVAQDLSEGLRSYFDVKEGALVSEVVPDSPAEKAGLKAGDVIIRIGDEDIEDEGDVREAIRDHKPGDRVDFVVVRDRQQQTFTVTLGEQEMPDLGSLDFNLEGLEGLKALEGLKDLQITVPDSEQMQQLEEKLNELHLKLDNMEPLDIHIEQLPDNGRIHIEKYMIGPVRNDGYGWQRSWQAAKDRLRSEFSSLSEDFARLRDELVALGNELMGRTA